MDFDERYFLCCSNERVAKDGVSVFFRARRSFIAISIFMWIFRFISGISLAKRLSTLRNINVVSEDCSHIHLCLYFPMPRYIFVSFYIPPFCTAFVVEFPLEIYLPTVAVLPRHVSRVQRV